MENRIHITVDKDWGSTGIWCKVDSSWGNAKYEDFPIPNWLIDRFNYWCDWYDSHIFKKLDFEESEWTRLEAYKLSLAIDLRRVLDSSYVIYIWDEELNGRVEITNLYS
ncbi:hypothetical protein KUV56_05080 [Ferrimonas balearica]|uniref:hypothetical protein n=1 Tax=Ferrimonas balearica TaxID=44012 RepID=UPI001C594ADE|nr:hypothetical protein [Ferrimonas balearica]MBW3138906.1 hypothetical protein [Ferrimonas balearica]